MNSLSKNQCPLCELPTSAEFAPFCSKKCFIKEGAKDFADRFEPVMKELAEEEGWKKEWNRAESEQCIRANVMYRSSNPGSKEIAIGNILAHMGTKIGFLLSQAIEAERVRWILAITHLDMAARDKVLATYDEKSTLLTKLEKDVQEEIANSDKAFEGEPENMR